MHAEQVIVRFFNAENGKPIRFRTAASIWVGDAASPVVHATDSNGEIALSITQAPFHEIRMLPDFPLTNRRIEDQAPPACETYQIAEILWAGIVSNRVFEGAVVPPQPGVLAIYLREKSNVERLREEGLLP